MKRVIFPIALCFIGMALNAQDISQTQKIPATYDRSSITFLFLEFPTDNHLSEVKGKIDSIQFSDKFYNNNVDFKVLSSPFVRGAGGLNKFEEIKKSIVEKKVARDIIAKWYSRNSDGTMSLNLVNERGMFNATDAAFLKAQTTKRGNATLEDYGNRLINLSYILVLDYQGVKTMKEAKLDKMRGWQATVNGYLYKIDYTEEVQNALYDIWIYDDDTPQVKAEKMKKFEELQFPISFVTETMVVVSASQAEGTTQIGRLIKQKSDDQLLKEMVQKGYEETVYSLEKKYEQFRVKTPISQVRPIRAKVGKKEGIKCDYRFFAYEYVYDEKTNSTKQKFRGVIRATSKIIDNRHVAKGDMGTTKFYQTAGRRLKTGYLLQQRNDFGGEFSLGYEIGEVGGVYGRLDLRLGRYIGFKSTFLYLEGGYESKNYENIPYGPNATDDVNFLRYGGGLAKGLMLMKNIELRPYVGIGQETASNKEWKDSGGSLSILYAKGGANLALNLKHNIQVVGGVGFYSFISYPTDEDDKEIEMKWNDIFKDRMGASSFVGIRFGF